MQFLVLVVVFLGLLTSCGQRKAPANDARFNIYKSQFQEEAKKRGIEITDGELSLPIAFGETGEGSDGICTIPGMGRNAFSAAANNLFNKENYDRKFILIHPDILEKDLFYIEAVVFHELAHCLLGRDHTEEKSLMNFSQERNTDYPMLRTVYLDELFGLEANFDDFNMQLGCGKPADSSEFLEDVLYRSFGRTLRYSIFPGDNEESSEVFCVNSILK
ncbi:MAG: hypothetical protein CME70_20250 [Halobacteriovorax sp.]|nr:hypothetical protein [Halobacteriovorax sp.]|tara:strand:- start:80063 stop:80716 length:654 start_codon:yes stop_codon:yes gene_type:complete